MQVHALLAMAHVSGGYSAEPLDLMDIRVGLLAQIVGTSAYVSIRQHTSAYVSIRQHPRRPPCPDSRYERIDLHTSAYVSIRQHTSASA
jgi:hypothetical protein